MCLFLRSGTHGLNEELGRYYVCGSELWEKNFVKDYIANVWEVRKQKSYGDDSCPNQVLDWGSRGLGLRGKGLVSDMQVRKLHFVFYRVTVGTCVILCILCMDTCMCSSAHSCGCVVDVWQLYYYHVLVQHI